MGASKRLVTRREIQIALDIDETFLEALETEQIVSPEDEGRYTPSMVERIRVCHTLHDELGVNFPGLEVALRLLETIHAERAQFQDVLDWIKAKLDARATRRDE